MSVASLSTPASPTRIASRAGRIALVLYVIVFLAFLVGPILLVVVASFSPSPFVTFPLKGLSLRWYARVADYKPFLDSLWLSLELAVLSSAIGSVFAIPAALALGRARNSTAAVAVGLLLSPLSIPGIIVGYSMLYFFSAMYIRPGFLALLIAHSIVAIPYILRTTLSVYKTMPPHAEEAAVILGANRLQVFVFVTAPQLSSAIFAGMLFSFLVSLNNLPISFFFGTASTSPLPVVMMSYLQNQFDPSVAAIATVQMALAVIALIVVDRIFGIGRLHSA
jgi:putative spermidine/putrescine transport system permease protein